MLCREIGIIDGGWMIPGRYKDNWVGRKLQESVRRHTEEWTAFIAGQMDTGGFLFSNLSCSP
jgi:hypothetical protein